MGGDPTRESADATGSASLVGEVVGDYRIIRELGRGAMGVVYLACHRMLKVEHALKFLHPTYARSPGYVRRFIHEAQQAAKLSHPNVVPVLNACAGADHLYMVMTYVQGESLAELLKREGPLPASRAVRYTYQACCGLQHAHELGLVHRDIKPDNILVDENDTARVADFGLVRDLEGDMAMTRAGAVLGTPPYMAPEQWDGRTPDRRIDVFALGVTLYALVSGRVPYPGKTPQEVIHRLATHGRVPLAEVAPKTDPTLAAIIDRMIEPDRERRFQSAREVAQELKHWHGATTISARMPAAFSAAGGLTPTPTPTTPPELSSPLLNGAALDPGSDIQPTTPMDPLAQTPANQLAFTSSSAPPGSGSHAISRRALWLSIAIIAGALIAVIATVLVAISASG